MKDLAKQFLSEDDRRRIVSAVKDAEKRTSGEIVPIIASASYDYPMADVIGAAAIAMPAAIVLTEWFGGRFWIGGQNMWLFMGAFSVLFIAGHFIVRRWPWLKRWFVSRQEMDTEVEEAAVTRFYREGLHRTRDETGVLIFVSVFERRVWILADRGINDKVAKDHWAGPVKTIIEGIRQRRQGAAICEAVAAVGQILSAHFPIKPDDRDELDNLIVESD
ncbi:MAG: hypothetical protein ABIL58_14205 [Pseudomonadota bacterium]